MKLIVGIVALLGLNVALYASGSRAADLVIPDCDSVAADTTKMPKQECFVGGPGSPSCQIPAGIKLDGGVSIGCSVTCMDDYYACCGLTCKCIPDEK